MAQGYIAAYRQAAARRNRWRIAKQDADKQRESLVIAINKSAEGTAPKQGDSK